MPCADVMCEVLNSARKLQRLPEGRNKKKQQQRSRRSIKMEKTIDRMKCEVLQRSVNQTKDKMKHIDIDEELRNIPEKEVNDKEQWLEDFRPIYDKAVRSINPNKKNKLIVKKYMVEVYAFAELKTRYERNKKVNDLLSQLKF
jgi:hypothetical protein